MRDVDIEKICTKSGPGEFSRAVIRFGYFGDVKMLEEVAKKVEIDVTGMRTLADFLNNEYRYEDLLALEYKAVPRKTDQRFAITSVKTPLSSFTSTMSPFSQRNASEFG